MTYAKAMTIVAPFATKIGDDPCVHVDNARPLLGPDCFARMMDSDKTRCPREGFVEPADVVTWLVIRDAEQCRGK